MKKQTKLLGGLLIVTLIMDQWSKYYISSTMQVYEMHSIIPSFFDILYVRNTGAGWSILEGQMLFFYGVTCVVSILLIYYYTTLKEGFLLTRIGIVLMLSGTFGNFIDRILFQYVRDFLSFNIFGYAFPVFNVADMCLVIGIGLWILDELLKGFGYYTK